MSKELKQCPFCGGEAKYSKIDTSKTVPFGTVQHFVTCKNNCLEGLYARGNTKEEAIKAWNRRPSPWHTGMPTEEDIKDIDEDNAYCFAICMFYDKWWLSDYLFKANIEKGCFEAETAHDGILEIPFERGYQWQKIEPYKERVE